RRHRRPGHPGLGWRGGGLLPGVGAGPPARAVDGGARQCPARGAHGCRHRPGAGAVGGRGPLAARRGVPDRRGARRRSGDRPRLPVGRPRRDGRVSSTAGRGAIVSGREGPEGGTHARSVAGDRILDGGSRIGTLGRRPPVPPSRPGDGRGGRTLEITTVAIEAPEDVNLILGQSHFIKTVEDLYEALVGSSPGLKFGLAFNEASGPRLVRHAGNDDELMELADRAASAVGAGHAFVVFLREGFPINVLNAVKLVPEV